MTAFFYSFLLLAAIAAAGLRNPWLEPFAHFGPHLLLGLCIGTLWQLRRKRFFRASIALPLITLHLVQLLPFLTTTELPPCAGKANPSFRVLLHNVHANNRRYLDLIAQIEQLKPEIIVLCEANLHLLDRMAHLENRYPHRIQAGRWTHSDLRDASGTVIWSKLPFADTRVESIDPAFIHALKVHFVWQGQTISLLALHPPSPVNSRQIRMRNLALQAVPALIEAHSPCLVVGDLNQTLWPPALRELESRTGLQSVFRSHGLRSTWPAFAYPFGIAIDHVFHSPELQCHGVQTLPGCGSDHRMLLCTFSLFQPQP
jgi:endonuclease/exonuclease/phosphatase (EEP) superfamily protein YafD